MDKACFDDDIEAWPHGPVVPAVYFQYLIFGSTNIPDQRNDGFEVISRQDKNHLDAIIDTATKYSTPGLERLIHGNALFLLTKRLTSPGKTHIWFSLGNCFKANMILEEICILFSRGRLFKEAERLMYDVQLIAKYVIHRYALDARPINNLKLQKILYFVQAEFLVSMNKACFDDDIEAWPHGPTVPAVYFEYNIFGNTNIPDQGNDGFETISKQDKNHLDAIIDTAAKYSASWLEKITLRQAPWKNAYKRDNKVIKQSELKEHFSS